MDDTRQLQADLEWVINSSSLIEIPQYNADTPVLPPPSIPSEKLQEAVKQKSRFLGPYFETLWKFLIEHSQSHDLIAHGLQVMKNRQTLGEFDFLLREQAGTQVIHQEVAVKYYLGVRLPKPTGTSATAEATEGSIGSMKASSAWFGPNSIDRLDLKLHKLLEQQIHLSDHPESIEALAHLGILTPPSKQILMKGYLFQPLNQSLTYPPHAHPKAAFGEWLPVCDLNKIRTTSDQWVALPKLKWLSRAHCDNRDVLSFEELQTQVHEADGRPILIAAMKESGKNILEEKQRYFIVSDQWEGKAIESLQKTPLTAYASHSRAGSLRPPCNPPV
ncbi:DUF1853 family protein [Hahella ganghwensis]|uniref:DUF1853 family protein n=1 Tax=Hahella ganghwensis TaxID=286420 RepID=UPI00035F90CD|nr:DUF1853 family protein [Hahella ganghwensis]